MWNLVPQMRRECSKINAFSRYPKWNGHQYQNRWKKWPTILERANKMQETIKVPPIIDELMATHFLQKPVTWVHKNPKKSSRNQCVFPLHIQEKVFSHPKMSGFLAVLPVFTEQVFDQFWLIFHCKLGARMSERGKKGNCARNVPFLFFLKERKSNCFSLRTNLYKMQKLMFNAFQAGGNYVETHVPSSKIQM